MNHNLLSLVKHWASPAFGVLIHSICFLSVTLLRLILLCQKKLGFICRTGEKIKNNKYWICLLTARNTQIRRYMPDLVPESRVRSGKNRGKHSHSSALTLIYFHVNCPMVKTVGFFRPLKSFVNQSFSFTSFSFSYPFLPSCSGSDWLNLKPAAAAGTVQTFQGVCSWFFLGMTKNAASSAILLPGFSIDTTLNEWLNGVYIEKRQKRCFNRGAADQKAQIWTITDSRRGACEIIVFSCRSVFLHKFRVNHTREPYEQSL